MNKLLMTALVLALSPAADAASCRAATAAQVGSEAGYNRAKAAADAWAKRQQTVSTSLSDCLGNISTTITAPTFPNLTNVLNQIGQKICKTARDKINDYVPSTIDPWGNLPTAKLSSYRVQTSPAAPARTAPVSQASGGNGSSFISLN